MAPAIAIGGHFIFLIVAVFLDLIFAHSYSTRGIKAHLMAGASACPI